LLRGPAVALALVTGCVPAPPSPDVSGIEGVSVAEVVRQSPVLRQDSVERFAREITYRVRNPGCGGVSLGSAFALGPNLLVTNQHVVEDGFFQLELSTWDGREVTADISSVSVWADIALIETAQTLPVVARTGPDPEPGQPVAAVGYPRGGQWTLSVGEVVDLVPPETFDTTHEVVRFDAPISPGNSGGPLLDESGDVVGVVFAVELGGQELSLAIPVSTLEDHMSRQAFSLNQSAC
jgi:S1-C subfamily serine protease